MPVVYDVIVVGARCAGSPLAMLLARAGHEVLLVDRATFPSDTLSTHFIQQPGMALAAAWGILDRIEGTGAPIVTHALIDGGEPVELEVPPVPTFEGPLAPRRTVLDKALVDEARASGAEVREGFTFTDVVVEDGRVTGIAGRTGAGETVREQARLVVGADGRNSAVAGSVGAEKYREVVKPVFGYYSYWEGFAGPPSRTEVHFLDDAAVILFPTNDGLMTVISVQPHDGDKDFKRDIERTYVDALSRVKSVAEGLAPARRVEKIRGAVDLPNFFRTPWGPGWALVGDAGHHKDPTPAAGISDAFLSVDLLSAAIDRFLRNEVDEDEALRDFHEQRDEALSDHYELCLRCANFDLPPNERASAFGEDVANGYARALEVAGRGQAVSS